MTYFKAVYNPLLLRPVKITTFSLMTAEQNPTGYVCVLHVAAQLSFDKNGFTKSYAIGVKVYFLNTRSSQNHYCRM